MEHRSAQLKILGGSPEAEKLQNGRFRLDFRCTGFSKSDWKYSQQEGRIFSNFGSLMDAEMSIDGLGGSSSVPEDVYPDMRLRKNKLEYTPSGQLVVFFSYETLTDEFVQIKDDDISYDTRGLRVVKRDLISRSGVEYQKTVGGATIAHSVNGEAAKTLYLAGYNINDDNAARTVTENWVEAGILNKSESVGPSSIPGTKIITYVSQGVPYYPDTLLEPTYDGISASADKSKLISINDTSIDGFTQFSRSYLVVTDINENITGLKYTVTGGQTRVQVPGVINCVSIPVSLGGVSGSIADVEPTPKTTKEVNVTQTIEITLSPPSSIVRAFNIDGISCAVLRKQVSLNAGPGNTVTFGTNNNRQSVTGENKNFSASSSLRVYPGYYLGTPSSDGSISYISSSYPIVTNNVSVMQEITSNQQTSCAGTGSSSPIGYNETGIVEQRGRPVYNTLDGTVYWEVTKWTAL